MSSFQPGACRLSSGTPACVAMACRLGPRPVDQCGWQNVVYHCEFLLIRPDRNHSDVLGVQLHNPWGTLPFVVHEPHAQVLDEREHRHLLLLQKHG